MQTRAIDFVVYAVSDVGKAISFYRDTLGMPLDTVVEGAWAEFSLVPVTLALVGPPWAEAPRRGDRGGATVALAVDDVTRAVTELRAKGVQVFVEPMETSVCHMAMIADPDGNRIWLHQRKDGTCG